jgi:hypothetical protein
MKFYPIILKNVIISWILLPSNGNFGTKSMSAEVCGGREWVTDGAPVLQAPEALCQREFPIIMDR